MNNDDIALSLPANKITVAENSLIKTLIYTRPFPKSWERKPFSLSGKLLEALPLNVRPLFARLVALSSRGAKKVIYSDKQAFEDFGYTSRTTQRFIKKLLDTGFILSVERSKDSATAKSRLITVNPEKAKKAA